MAAPLPPAGLRWSLPGAADHARRSGALRRPDAGAAFAGALHAYLLRSAPLSLRARSGAPQAAADRAQLDSLLRELLEHAAAAALVLGPPDDGDSDRRAPPPLAAAYARPIFPPLDGGGGGGGAEDEEAWEGRGAMACSVEHW
ncbi:hypothetical protein MNEG_14943 [Monoraphidium neglectum]|uniref:Uncharacterized protein n=1 Tax=Monoraphidium neglectum TaxID=145388 RepID=A0A0D2LTJ7_9CHLO|nr:hypothetical protein MNEG_14943 [Monoraphidium neglectum]KIY93021.1 hypothetical protein MNEG_14943 [Monoraphidium neglectum]|eukprot:XP_013892041.1 hypothetical protein MNEG_14943 [Monoraphidium neglectum]